MMREKSKVVMMREKSEVEMMREKSKVVMMREKSEVEMMRECLGIKLIYEKKVKKSSECHVYIFLSLTTARAQLKQQNCTIRIKIDLQSSTVSPEVK